MTDPESAVAVEPTGTPIPEPSQEPGQQTSGSPDVDALVKAILAHPDYQKDKQSVKDKRIAEIQTNLEAQGGDLARIAAKLGATPEQAAQAQRDLAIEDMAKEYLKSKSAPKQAPSQAPQGSGVDLAEARTSILNQIGLADAPTGFDDYLASLDWNNPINATLSASKWAAEQQANAKQPTAATTPPPTGSIPASSLSGLSNDELGAKLLEYQKEPKKYAKEREEIGEEFKRRDNT